MILFLLLDDEKIFVILIFYFLFKFIFQTFFKKLFIVEKIGDVLNMRSTFLCEDNSIEIRRV